MERRKFTREFKLEAVKPVTGVTAAQAARDLGVMGRCCGALDQEMPDAECAHDKRKAGALKR